MTLARGRSSSSCPRGKGRVAVHLRPLGTLPCVISKVQWCDPCPSYAQGTLVSNSMAQRLKCLCVCVCVGGGRGKGRS